MSLASVILCPTRKPISNRLSIRDKIEICRWEVDCPLPKVARVVIHERVEAECHPIDLVLVYGADSPWARWGLARRGNTVTLWQCSDGADLGVFDTMSDALAALAGHAYPPVSAEAAARS
jgi:hypothetical protein